MRDPATRALLRQLGMLATAGITIAVATGIGYFIGDWLDRHLDTEPWLTILFAALGIAAGFIEFFRLVTRVIREQERNERR